MCAQATVAAGGGACSMTRCEPAKKVLVTAGVHHEDRVRRKAPDGPVDKFKEHRGPRAAFTGAAEPPGARRRDREPPVATLHPTHEVDARPMGRVAIERERCVRSGPGRRLERIGLLGREHSGRNRNERLLLGRVQRDGLTGRPGSDDDDGAGTGGGSVAARQPDRALRKQCGMPAERRHDERDASADAADLVLHEHQRRRDSGRPVGTTGACGTTSPMSRRSSGESNGRRRREPRTKIHQGDSRTPAAGRRSSGSGIVAGST